MEQTEQSMREAREKAVENWELTWLGGVSAPRLNGFKDGFEAGYAARDAAVQCTWSDEGDEWQTSCGHGFQFEADGPIENGFKFCGYCGGGLKVQPYQQEDEGK